MNRIKNEVGDSVSNYDPKFSGTRERVDHADPATEVQLRELTRVRLEIQEKQAEILRLEELGAAVAEIKEVEDELDALVEVLAELMEEGGDFESPGAELDGYISIGDLIGRDLDHGAELDSREREIRVDSFRALMRFVFQDGASDLGLAFRHFLAVANRTTPDFLGGVSKADIAALLGETRAATSNREIRLIEKFMRRSGAAGWKLLGDNTSEETRERSARAARGNTSRRSGSRLKYGL